MGVFSDLIIHSELQAYEVLIIIDHYLPGRLAGGPVTTISNMTHLLTGHVRCLVVTRNYDLDGGIYSSIEPGKPYSINGATVLYLEKKRFNSSTFRQLTVKHGVRYVYLNGFFSPTTIRLLLAHQVSKLPARLVVAPRGEFSRGALALKTRKKALYLGFFRQLRLWKNIDVFQASTVLEQEDIWRVLGPVPVKVAADVPAPVNAPSVLGWVPASRLVFIGRISPMKNLDYAISVLATLTEPVQLDIYGPLEDQTYWKQCLSRIATCPAHVKIRYCGVLEHDQVGLTFAQYDAFLFPTRGENYGHVIHESLAAGCPVIVSDQTPWQELQDYSVGWTLPLDHPQGFTEAIRQTLHQAPQEAQARRQRCIDYAIQISTNPEVLADNLALFPKLPLASPAVTESTLT